MIWTVVRINLINLLRDRVALALTFVLPLAFFSVFAVIFGGMGGDGTSRVRIAVVDEDNTEVSRRVMEALAKESALRVTSMREVVNEGREGGAASLMPLDRAFAEAMIKDGDLPVAVIIEKGFSESFGMFGLAGSDTAGITLLADTSDPVAPQMVAGLLQKVGMTAAPDVFVQRGVGMLDQFGGGLTEQQRAAMAQFLPMLKASSQGDAHAFDALAQESAGDEEHARAGEVPVAPPDATPPDATPPDAAPSDAASPDATSATADESTPAAAFSGPISVRIVDVLGETKTAPVIAFYAGAVAVLFLLFSATGGAGTLLEEEESGALDRLLACGLGMGRLLAGKWVLLTVMGIAQVTLMFLWGALVFGVELFTPPHLAGFAVMTIVTAAAAAGFGLVLATACRSRAQLGGISTVVILVMSAVGGSMFPRFMMPDMMKKIGLLTFNAWALDGYQKVFWFEKPLLELWPQVGVLLGLTISFLCIARILARRWEVV